MICDELARDRIEGRDDRNDVDIDTGRANDWMICGDGSVRVIGVNIWASGVVVVGRSKRDKGGKRGILSISMFYPLLL